jgi:FtsH-binding integral membrane protein
MFLAYCALSGVTFSIYLLAYTRTSVASTLFVTGGTFLAMSVYGSVARKDLSSWGSFLMMGLIGVVLASVVNYFLRSDALEFVLSCAGVVVFTGLTAYDTQKIRALARVGDDRLALHGALALYLDFVNLFIMLLRLFGRRR